MTEQTVRLIIEIQPDSDATPGDYECYDEAQKQAWKNDEWSFVGLHLKVEFNDNTTGCSKTYKSGGIWAVEYDGPNGEYRPHWFSIAGDELINLQQSYPELADISMGLPCTIKEIRG